MPERQPNSVQMGRSIELDFVEETLLHFVCEVVVAVLCQAQKAQLGLWVIKVDKFGNLSRLDTDFAGVRQQDHVFTGIVPGAVFLQCVFIDHLRADAGAFGFRFK